MDGSFFCHCLLQLSSQILASLHVPIPRTEALSEGFGFQFVITGLSTRALFTSCLTHILPNSHDHQPVKFPHRHAEKECVRLPGSLAIVPENWNPLCSESILAPHHTPCFLSIILEHRVLGRQFCPQDVCMQTLPSKSQSSRLLLTIQTLE